MKENIKVDDLKKTIKEIKESIDFDKKAERVAEIEKEVGAPHFWNDKTKAQETMKELGELKELLDKVRRAEETIQDLEVATQLGMSDELKVQYSLVDKLLGELEFTTYLSSFYDKKNAIVSIHAGQGGVEAMDWVSMLYRMYTKYFENKGWSTQMVELSSGEEAGIKSITVRVGGQYVYGYLKGEAGTHRLVRQSPFNADKLRQTSFALVEVLPELEEIDSPEIQITDSDLEWQFFRASTQGGQNVQKVSTAVRLTHKPTGLVVTAQAERYQERNRKIALNLLRAKLWARQQEEMHKEKKEIKGVYKPASWGNQIRSYVLHPYKMVKDLRTEVETSDTEGVLNGELDEFIKAELKLFT